MPKKRKSRDQDGVYRRPDSPYWWASFIGESGARVRRSTGKTDRREAISVLAAWRLDTTSHEESDTAQHTFDELMVAYLMATEGRRRNEDVVRLHVWRLKQSFSEKVMETLSASDVTSYIQTRKTDGGVSNATVNRELEVLSAAINFAGRELDWVIPNPVVGRMLKEPEGRLRWLTRPEAVTLIRAAETQTKAPHLGPLIQLALHTGMRRGELLGLEWERVDLHSAIIYLESQHTKAGKRRTVPINAVARNAILNRARFRAEHCPDAPWVFCDAKGTRIASVQRSFGTACERAGIMDFRFHDLRHTCAAWLVQAGVPLTEVRDVLGHSTIKMTERYAHLAPENVRAALALLEGPESR
jgi:integrase